MHKLHVYTFVVCVLNKALIYAFCTIGIAYMYQYLTIYGMNGMYIKLYMK